MKDRQYLELATKEIKYIFVRKRIRRELKDHIDDRREFFMEKGFSPEEAEKKTMEIMGNPQEVGLEMNRLYPPLWNYLFLVTTCMTIIALWMLLPFVLEAHIQIVKEPTIIENGQIVYRNDRIYQEEQEGIHFTLGPLTRTVDGTYYLHYDFEKKGIFSPPLPYLEGGILKTEKGESFKPHGMVSYSTYFKSKGALVFKEGPQNPKILYFTFNGTPTKDQYHWEWEEKP